jgi:hydrogenase expression/formation protein HypC
MCLAVPGKIISIDKKNQNATIDYGNNVIRTINVSLVDVKPGDYVLVHAGFAIQMVDPKDAEETLSLFHEILSQGDDV